MRSPVLNKILPNALILAIGLLSFLYYSALCFKGYNADLGIHLLMAEDLSLPRDLYYRGQDRLGSLIPIVAHFFVLFGASALVAVSIAQYLLLAACFFFLRPFFQPPWQGILLAAALFMPNWAFLEQVLVGHPYIGHLFFLSGFLYLYFKAPLHNQALRFFLLALLACLALWASEMAVVNFLIFALVYRKKLFAALKQKQVWISAGVGTILGLTFLTTAKVSGTHTANFYHFLANGDQILVAIKRLFGSVYEQAVFAGNKPPARFLFWVMFLLTVNVLMRRRRIPQLAKFFLLSATGMLVLVLLSYWPVINDYPLRYYTPAFLQLLFFFILMGKNSSVLQKGLTITAVALSGYTGLYVLHNFSLEVDDRLNREEMVHFTKLGKIGIIGSYWNTHAVDALSTEVVATPYDGHYNRMYEKIPQVLAQDTIVIIRNGFLETLPDSIVQFDRPLKRIGPIERLHEFEYAYYR